MHQWVVVRNERRSERAIFVSGANFLVLVQSGILRLDLEDSNFVVDTIKEEDLRLFDADVGVVHRVWVQCFGLLAHLNHVVHGNEILHGVEQISPHNQP